LTCTEAGGPRTGLLYPIGVDVSETLVQTHRSVARGAASDHQVLPDYASKAFYKARDLARDQTRLFDGMSVRQMPTLHEIRALSSHLYATAGYEVAAVQELMAHTDPDMTRAYQKGHARKVLRIEMMLPYRVPQPDNAVREQRAVYRVGAPPQGQEKFPENSLIRNGVAA
jgi:integrase